MLHSYAVAAIVSYALRRFCDTIDLLVSKRNHYNKETKMRKSRTTVIEKTLPKQCVFACPARVNHKLTQLPRWVNFSVKFQQFNLAVKVGAYQNRVNL